MRELSIINDDLMTLSNELEGLKSMVNTVALSVNYFNVNESDAEKLERLAAPYPAIVSALDTIIKKLDGYTSDLDALGLHLNKSDVRIA